MATTAASTMLIAAFNHGREPERLAMKYKLMRTNPFVFLRGTAHLFHQRYVEAGLDGAAPAAWCCNDLHLENFGTYLGDTGLTYFDINDFDEAALAPADWDIVRLATSILVAALPLGLENDRAAALTRQVIERYANEINAGKPRWLERKTADGPIGALIDELRHRDDVGFLDKRTVVKKGVRRLDVDDRRMLAISKPEREVVGRFLDSLPNSDHPKSFFHMLDCARRVAGTGSLGLPRTVVLVEGNGSPDGNVLLDLKAAVPSAAATFSPCRQPAWPTEADRIVTLQSRCQAVTPAYLRAVTFDGGSFTLKMLQPSADRLDLARLAKSAGDFDNALLNMASLTAWSQLRSTGRQGSAQADDLIAMVGTAGFSDSVIERARTMEAVVHRDFATYAAAYDAGQMS